MRGLRKLFPVLIGILLLCVPVSVRADAGNRFTASLRVDEELYWGKAVSRMPLLVELQNSAGAFEGTLELTIALEEERIYMVDAKNSERQKKQRSVCYKKEVRIPKNGSISEPFLVLLPQNAASCRLRLLRGEQVVWEKTEEINFSYASMSELQIVILSDNPDLLLGERTGFYGGNTARYRIVKPQELQKRWFERQMADVLVFQSYTKEELSDSLQRAIWRWEQRGGKIMTEPEETQVKTSLNLLLNDSSEAVGFVNGLDSVYEESRYYETLKKTPVREQPNLLFYLLLMVCYAGFVGPVLYYILKKRNKRQFLRLSMYITSLVCIGIIGIGGIRTRVSAPFISYVERFRQEEGMLRRSIYFQVQAPFTDDYTMYVDADYQLAPAQFDMNASGIAASWEQENAEQVEITYGKEKNRLHFSNLRAYSPQYFSLRKEESAAGLFDGEVRLFEEQLSGEIRNQSNWNLEQAILFLPNSLIWLGELPAGECLDLSGKEVYYFDRMDSDWIQKLAASEEDLRYEELKNLWYWEGWDAEKIQYRSEAMVLGIVKNADTSFQMNSGYETNGLSLYSFPVSVDMTQGNELFCPYAHAQRVQLDKKYWEDAPEYHNMFTDCTEYQYYLDRVLEEESLLSEFEPLKLRFAKRVHREDGGRYFQGTIELYNHRTECYEPIQTDAVLEGAALAPYISAANVLQVRYKSREKNEEAVILPAIEVRGRLVRYHAENQ